MEGADRRVTRYDKPCFLQTREVYSQYITAGENNMFKSPFRVTGYKSLITFCLLLVISMNVPADGSSQPGEDEAFTRAVETYRAEENQEALKLFQSFMEEYPDSMRIDDTYWYLGRLYMRLEDRDTALDFYKRVLHWPERSSRLSATLFALAKIYYGEREYQKVIDLLGFHETGGSLNRNDLRFLFLAGKSFYHLGYGNLKNYRRSEAAAYFTRAIDIFTLIGDSATDTPVRIDALLALGKTCLKAMDAAEHRASYTALYETLSDAVAVLE